MNSRSGTVYETSHNQTCPGEKERATYRKEEEIHPERDAEMRLVRKRQGGVADPIQVRDRVLELRDTRRERARRRGLQLPVAHEPREVARQEQRDLERHVRVDRLGAQALARQRARRVRRTGTRRERWPRGRTSAEWERKRLQNAKEGHVVKQGLLWWVPCVLQGAQSTLQGRTCNVDISISPPIPTTGQAGLS